MLSDHPVSVIGLRRLRHSAPVRPPGSRQRLAAVTLATIACAALVWGVASWLGGAGAEPQAARLPAPRTAVERAYGKLPMRFEANRGQTAAPVKFLSRGAGYSLFLTRREAVLSLTKPQRTSKAGAATVVRMGLIGANPRPAIEGDGRLAGVSNYLKGSDPHKWQTAVPGFGQVRYRAAYPGIDMVFHGGRGGLEYDFELAPGRDPGRIALRMRGARRLSLDRSGDLLLHTAAGTLLQRRPVAYQPVPGGRRAVPSRYVLEGTDRVAFKLGAYDHSRPLVIDPELRYSTYLGGSDKSSLGFAIAADAAGSAYVAGYTGAMDFPTTAGVIKPAITGDEFDTDLTVTKLSPDGSSLVYSTYLGGSGTRGSGAELPYDIAVDAAGRAFVTGTTTSANFPTTPNAFNHKRGMNFVTDGFLSVLNPTATGLDYSTRLPTKAYPSGIALDSAGKAYLTGDTTADTLPVRSPAPAGPFQPTLAGPRDVFVAKFDPAASGDSSLVYATYLGGSDYDNGGSIALDSSDNAYVTGLTKSADFPTRNGYQDTPAGAPDAYVSKLDPQGSALAYSTYLGGSGPETGFPPGFGLNRTAMAVDSTGHAYVIGTTRADDFPIKNAFQSARGGGTCTDPFFGPLPCADAYVAKLDPGASGAASLIYSSYLGGSGDDVARGVGLDSAGGVYVAGYTASTDFPSVSPVAPRGAVTPPIGRETDFNYGDAWVARVKPDGSGLSFSTSLGGGGGEEASDLAVDPSGSAYVGGSTFSTDFPTVNAFQSTDLGRGSSQVVSQFVAKIAAGDPQAPLVTGLAPRSGSTEGGAAVVIAGSGLSGASAVTFGGVPAESFTVDSDAQITAVAPAHAVEAVPVVVEAGGRSSPPNPAASFAYGEGSFAPTGALGHERSRAGAVLLGNGKVLVAGGSDGSGPMTSAELYDPASGGWTATGSLQTARCSPTMTLLPNGKVLAAGGSIECNTDNFDFQQTASAELYDPASGTWKATKQPMSVPRTGHSATLLPDGTVLVAGGRDGLTSHATSELYDPTSETWSPTTGPLNVARDDHGAALLGGAPCAAASPPSSCGKVLIAGGEDILNQGGLTSAELYDPASGTWTLTTGELGERRSHISAVSLPDGRVLAAGGCTACGAPFFSTSTADVYDPATDTWSVTGIMRTAPRHDYAAALLASGRVLLVGGDAADSVLNSGEVYDPTLPVGTAKFTSAGLMTRYRDAPFAVALSSGTGCGDNCGKVLIGGDLRQAGASSELYSPPRVRPPRPTPGPGPGPGPTAGPGPGRDTTRPVISGLRVSPARFRAGSRLPRLARAARVGTRIRFSLSEPATVKLAFAAQRAGRRVGRHCRRPSRRLRRRRRCTRFVTASPRVTIKGARAGSNSVRFQGRLSRRRRLRPGRYRLTATATDAAGNRSRPKHRRLRVTRRPRKH